MPHITLTGPYEVVDGSDGRGEVFWIVDGNRDGYADPFQQRHYAQAMCDAINWAYVRGWKRRDKNEHEDGIRTNLLDLELEAGHLQMGLAYEGPRLVRSLIHKHGSLRKAARATGYSACYLSRIEREELVMSARCYLRLTDPLDRGPIKRRRSRDDE